MRLLPVALAVCCLWSVPSGAGGREAQHRAEARIELLKLLSGGNPNATLARLNYLGEQSWAAVELASAWNRLTDDAQRRNVALVVAGLGAAQSEGLLIAFTGSDDPAVRMSGAQGLGRLRTGRSDVLVPLLEDRSLAVRREAAKALGTSRNPGKLGNALLRAAKAEGEPEVRAAMLEAAGRTGDKKLVPALAGFLGSSSEATRFAAARGLCLLGAHQGFEFAQRLFASDDRFVRRQGVALFEGLPAKVAKPYLEPRLDDPDKRVAAAAARILYQGGDDSKLEWLVLASYLSNPDQKLIVEQELEALMLTDDRRKAILQKAGIR